MASLEIDPPAARTQAKNFFGDETRDIFEVHSKPRDIITTEARFFAQELGLAGAIDSQIDIIVGGPPCQAYARVGRAKLREVAEHPEVQYDDNRTFMKEGRCWRD